MPVHTLYISQNRLYPVYYYGVKVKTLVKSNLKFLECWLRGNKPFNHNHLSSPSPFRQASIRPAGLQSGSALEG